MAGCDATHTPREVQDPFLGLEDLYEYLQENPTDLTALSRRSVVGSEDGRELLGLDRAGPWEFAQVNPKT